MEAAKFNRLIDRYLERELSDAEFMELEEALRTNADARFLYRERMDVESALATWARSDAEPHRAPILHSMQRARRSVRPWAIAASVLVAVGAFWVVQSQHGNEKHPTMAAHSQTQPDESDDVRPTASDAPSDPTSDSPNATNDSAVWVARDDFVSGGMDLHRPDRGDGWLSAWMPAPGGRGSNASLRSLSSSDRDRALDLPAQSAIARTLAIDLSDASDRPVFIAVHARARQGDEPSLQLSIGGVDGPQEGRSSHEIALGVTRGNETFWRAGSQTERGRTSQASPHDSVIMVMRLDTSGRRRVTAMGSVWHRGTVPDRERWEMPGQFSSSVKAYKFGLSRVRIAAGKRGGAVIDRIVVTTSWTAAIGR